MLRGVTVDEFMGLILGAAECCDESRLRELWAAHRSALIAAWPTPGERPWAWWHFERRAEKPSHWAGELAELVRIGKLTAREIEALEDMPGREWLRPDWWRWSDSWLAGVEAAGEFPVDASLQRPAAFDSFEEWQLAGFAAWWHGWHGRPEKRAWFERYQRVILDVELARQAQNYYVRLDDGARSLWREYWFEVLPGRAGKCEVERDGVHGVLDQAKPNRGLYAEFSHWPHLLARRPERLRRICVLVEDATSFNAARAGGKTETK